MSVIATVKAIRLLGLYPQENRQKQKQNIMRGAIKMDKPEIFEMPNFEYTPQGFNELKAALKSGKIVRNPFAKFYGDKVEVNVILDKDTDNIVRKTLDSNK